MHGSCHNAYSIKRGSSNARIKKVKGIYIHYIYIQYIYVCQYKHSNYVTTLHQVQLFRMAFNDEVGSFVHQFQ